MNPAFSLTEAKCRRQWVAIPKTIRQVPAARASHVTNNGVLVVPNINLGAG
jgi:hypothetical protein